MKTNKLILLTLLAGSIFLLTCKKVEKLMLVSTGTVSNILITTADISGTVLDLGDGATQYGHCYATTPNPNISGSKTELGTPALGGYTSALTGLTQGTKYYIKAYMSRGKEAVYGDEITFTTASSALPEVTTNADITGTTKTAAVSGGNVTDEGGTPVTSRGVCWSTATNPEIGGNKTTNGSGTGSFTSNITGLTAGTKYYVRAYATNSGGTAYGNEVSFTTVPEAPTLPTVVTAAVNSVTVNSAVCGGEVTNEGGAAVTARGVCWSITQHPDINGNKTIDGDGPGSFVSNLSGLDGNTTYYIRAYAINSVGPAYGNERDFKTGPILPDIITSDVTAITPTSATSGGNITSDGGSAVTARGICWSTSQNPTVGGNHTDEGSGTGNFISNMAGLTPGTTYYVRAYAINGVGTKYANELNFKAGAVLPTVTTATVTSVTSSSGIGGGNVTNDGGATVTTRGICWSTNHNPTTSDSKVPNGSGLGSYTGNITGLSPGTTYYVKAYATNSAGTGYGDEAPFTTNPVVPTLTTTAATSVTYNSALSGGNVTSDGGAAVTVRGVCWSTSQNPTTANSKTIDGAGTGIFSSTLSNLSPSSNYWIRAYATNSAGTGYGPQQPFSTPAAPYITVLTPTGSDHWMDLENRIISWTSNISENVLISLYKSSSLLLMIVSGSGTPNDGSYTWTLPNNLIYGSDYKIRITSVNNNNIYGESPLFKISESTGSTGTVADADGNTYNTVKIGTQWWTKQNLKTTRFNDFSFITSQLNISTWLTLTEAAYCYYESNMAYQNTYGALYNWYTVASGKLCPVGWHVPSTTEWDVLVAFVGGEPVAGGKLKEAGTTHWFIPNTSADNAFGFTALPGGYLVNSKGYGNLTQTAFFWSSTMYSSANSDYIKMEYNTASTFKSNMPKYGGLSVRCVKD
jgi:uncharacterized protein (TIGR02145 family)